MTLEEEYEAFQGRSWQGIPRHSISEHNHYIRDLRRCCPHCQVGSVPVPDAALKEER
jgi:hypothetical protein